METLHAAAITGLGVLVLLCVALSNPAPVNADLRTQARNTTTQNAPTFDTVTIGWVGDMVPSDGISYNEHVFDAVRGALQKPDLMIGNLEGTFATSERLSKCRYLKTLCHAFRGDASFATSLDDAGFDLVSLINNHSYDFGDAGLSDTESALHDARIPFIAPDQQTASFTVKGLRIGILGLSSTKPAETISDYGFIAKAVRLLKKDHDYVIVIFHGGAEGADKTTIPHETEYVGTENRGNVAMVAHIAIDNGANLVLGSGPHVLRPTEAYKGATIAYSLGNFVGGNGKLVTKGPLGISGIFTATITLDANGDATTSGRIAPVTLSPAGIPSPRNDR